MKKQIIFISALILYSVIVYCQVKPSIKIKKTEPVKSIQNTQFKGDMELSKVEILVLNPGDKAYSANQPIYTHSSVRLCIYYKNIGTALINLAKVQWNILDGPFNKGRTLSQKKILAPGEEDTDVLNYFGAGEVKAGDYNIRVCFDYNKILDEASTQNNTITQNFKVIESNKFTGLPDLKFVAVTSKLDTATSCGNTNNYIFDATVINAGNFPASILGNYLITADAPLTTDYNEGYNITLMPQQTKTIQFKASFQNGTKQTIKFISDKSNQVKESDKTNNTATIDINIPHVSNDVKGDLIVDEAHFEFTKSNQLYWLVVKIKNVGIGTIKLCQNTPIWTTVDAPNGFSWTGTTANKYVFFKPGDIYEPSTTAVHQISNGIYKFKIKVNYNSLYPETNENNNISEFTIRIPEDLVIK
ncbi:MAG: CARDB domain-containing protein [Bacteroidales bacterium]|jgi:subtilase family serine protease